MTTRAPHWIPSAQPQHNRWIQRLAKLGFAAQGVVYALIGIFAAQSALGQGGQVGGGTEAVRTVGQQPFGQILLVLIGIGLLGYALWRMIEAILDANHEGRSGKGLLRRVGYAASALMNGAVGIVALQLAIGTSSGSSGEPDTFVGKLMAQPMGQILVALLGAAAIAFGIQQIKSGYTKSFLDKLDVSRLSAQKRTWLTRSGMVGLISRGVVFGIIGVFLIKAAVEHDPGTSIGVGGALRIIASQPLGVALLLVVAVGLLGYGVFQIVRSKYARLPAH